MNKILLGAAALFAVTAPATAFAEGGYVGASYANIDAGGDDSSSAWGLDGAVDFGAATGIGVALDAAALNVDDDSEGTDTAWNLGGHLYTRSEAHLLGLFLNHSDDGVLLNQTSAGVEAEKFFSGWTLAGAVGYGRVETDSFSDGVTTYPSAEADLWGVNVEGRFFLSDNLRLDARAGWANVSVDDSGSSNNDDSVFSYGLGGEWQVGGSPVSLRAAWNHSEADETDVDTDAFTLGVRWNLGTGSLKQRDRSGASLAGLGNLAGTGIF